MAKKKYSSQENPTITYEEVVKMLTYDKDSGVFTWANPPGPKIKKGRIAGGKNSDGYINIKFKLRNYKAHRLAWLYMEGYFPEDGIEIDHIDRDRSNNKWSNLRLASKACNIRNSKVHSDNTSGVTGVSLASDHKKWIARISVNSKMLYIGRYDTFNDAVVGRYEKELEYGYDTCNSMTSAKKYLLEKGYFD